MGSCLTLGGAYGGADFNPYNKSDGEIQRFCQSYMTELSKYIGANVDLPGVGDMGATEIGYTYGQYKRFNEQYESRTACCGAVRLVDWKLQAWAWYSSPRPCWRARRWTSRASACSSQARTSSPWPWRRRCGLGGIPFPLATPPHIYEPQGIDKAKLKTIAKIKGESVREWALHHRLNHCQVQRARQHIRHSP